MEKRKRKKGQRLAFLDLSRSGLVARILIPRLAASLSFWWLLLLSLAEPLGEVLSPVYDTILELLWIQEISGFGLGRLQGVWVRGASRAATLCCSRFLAA